MATGLDIPVLATEEVYIALRTALLSGPDLITHDQGNIWTQLFCVPSVHQARISLDIHLLWGMIERIDLFNTLEQAARCVHDWHVAHHGYIDDVVTTLSHLALMTRRMRLWAVASHDMWHSISSTGQPFRNMYIAPTISYPEIGTVNDPRYAAIVTWVDALSVIIRAGRIVHGGAVSARKEDSIDDVAYRPIRGQDYTIGRVAPGLFDNHKDTGLFSGGDIHPPVTYTRASSTHGAKDDDFEEYDRTFNYNEEKHTLSLTVHTGIIEACVDTTFQDLTNWAAQLLAREALARNLCIKDDENIYIIDNEQQGPEKKDSSGAGGDTTPANGIVFVARISGKAAATT